MKKIKLIKSITPIVGAGIIATAIAPLCSCKSNNSEDKKPDPTPTKGLVKLNASLAPKDINPLNLDKTSPLTITGNFVTKETIYVINPFAETAVVVQYRIADKYSPSWPSWTNCTQSGSTTIELHADELIQFRAYSPTVGTFSTQSDQIRFQFYGGQDDEGWTIGGSLMSLLCDKDSLEQETMYATNQLTNSYCFASLFQGCSGIKHVSQDLLPFKVLTDYCYQYMFDACEDLCECPSLPATELKKGCYEGMFFGCTSLQSTPHLPATKLVTDCYKQMFYNCTNLRVASLAYVGNFDSTYFQKWLGGTLAKGKLYYNGWDTEKGENAIPENFEKTIDQDFINRETVTFEIVSDDETSALKTKPIVRCMKDEKVTDTYAQLLTAHCAIYPDTDTFDHYLDKDGNKLETLTEDKTAEDLFTLTKAAATENGKLIAKYGFYPTEIPDVCNCITNAASSITVSWPTTTDAGTVAEYCIVEPEQEDKWISFQNGEETYFDSRKQIKLRAIQKSSAVDKYINFKISGDVKLCGSVMSLLKPNDDLEAENVTVVPAFGCYNMFAGSKGITEISSDFLTKAGEDESGAAIKVTELKYMCFANMFNGCVNLVDAPEIPNLTTKSGCFYQMFRDCISLVTVGDLPSGTIAEAYDTNKYGTYEGMFRGCYKLGSDETNPIMPNGIVVNTKVPHCAFDHMFSECKALKTAPKIELATSGDYPVTSVEWESGEVDSVKKSPFACMFEQCYAMTDASNVKITIPKVGDDVSIGYAGFYRMFAECTILNTWPSIQSNITYVAKCAMQEMFLKCTKLQKVPFTMMESRLGKDDHQDEYSFYKMFQGCTSLTKPLYIRWFEHQMDWCYAYMYSGCSSLKVKYGEKSGLSYKDPSLDSNRFIKLCAFNTSDGRKFCKGIFEGTGGSVTSPGEGVWYQYSYQWYE